ncbi:MAG: hypothetical protein Q8942_05180 [Bacillota bacterium]|nr:hypothetical protein [Bacillota bacterium]
MSKGLPTILQGKKICIICEGYEEYEYILKLIELKVWNSEYIFYPINAETNGNIPARYQDAYQSDSYDIVLIFCDTDKKPYHDYELIKQKINNFHGNDVAADLVVIYGNPCTMQIIILHWDDIKLTSPGKHKSGIEIKRLLGIDKYKAREDQRQQLFANVTKDNYLLMKERVKKLLDDDTKVSSSNFGKFIRYFSGNDMWIKEINDSL